MIKVIDETPVLGYHKGDVVRILSGDVFTGQIKDTNPEGSRYRVIDSGGVSQWVWKSEIARHATSKEASEYFKA